MSVRKKFPLITGDLSMDLVNTEVVRYGKVHNLLETADDLFEWLEVMRMENEYLTKEFIEALIKDKENVYQKVMSLRVVLRKAFEQIACGEPIGNHFIQCMEAYIRAAPITYEFEKELLKPVPVGNIQDQLCSLIALEVMQFMKEKKLQTIKSCANESCVLLFFDKTGRRKWCSMKICGNREKVARFQQKKN